MQSAAVRADFRRSALDAYHQDHLEDQRALPAPVEATAIAVCAVLDAERDAQSSDVLARASAIARTFQKPASLPPTGCWEDPISVESPTSDIRALLSPLRLVRGDSALGSHLLDSLLAIVPERGIERGRVMSSITLHLVSSGKLEEAPEYLRAVIRLGEALRSEELQFKGWASLSHVALVSGNLPRCEETHRHAMAHAVRLDDPRARGRVGITEGAIRGLHGDFAGSLEVLWEAFGLLDCDWTRGIAMANIAETLARIGHFRAARAARSMLLRTVQSRYLSMVNLGAYAFAAAALGDLKGVRWAVARARRLADETGNTAVGVAQGLLGCADACAIAGLDDLARQLYHDGMQLADAGGYHDLRFRPDPTVTRPSIPGAQSLSGNAEMASRSVTDLAPDGVPEELELLLA